MYAAQMMENAASEKINLHSPHSSEECYKRLQDSVDTSVISLLGSKSVSGSVSRTSIRIRKKNGDRDPFHAVLKASMKPNPQGTIISGCLGMHYFVEGSILIWFSWALIISGLILAIALLSFLMSGSIWGESAWTGILLPAGMIILLWGLLLAGRLWSRKDSRFLKKFLMDILEAKEGEAQTLD